MAKRHFPSVEALSSNDDERWICELRLSAVRERVATLRSLLEELDRLLPLSDGKHASSEEQDLRAAVARELAKLGCRVVEVASALSGVRDPVAVLEMVPARP